MKKLVLIQSELKAPKGQFNSFGKYKYRSCEDILEAVKPILVKHNCVLSLSDEVVLIGDRFYVKATACVYDADTGESQMTTAYAREEEDKKGQDGSQITGTASSYARKYALNGLFCIDDTKDADTDEYANTTKRESKKDTKKDTNAMSYREKVIALANEKGISTKELANDYNLSGTTTEAEFKAVLEHLEGK